MDPVPHPSLAVDTDLTLVSVLAPAPAPARVPGHEALAALTAQATRFVPMAQTRVTVHTHVLNRPWEPGPRGVVPPPRLKLPGDRAFPLGARPPPGPRTLREGLVSQLQGAPWIQLLHPGPLVQVATSVLQVATESSVGVWTSWQSLDLGDTPVPGTALMSQKPPWPPTVACGTHTMLHLDTQVVCQARPDTEATSRQHFLVVVCALVPTATMQTALNSIEVWSSRVSTRVWTRMGDTPGSPTQDAEVATRALLAASKVAAVAPPDPGEDPGEDPAHQGSDGGDEVHPPPRESQETRLRRHVVALQQPAVTQAFFNPRFTPYQTIISGAVLRCLGGSTTPVTWTLSQARDQPLLTVSMTPSR